MILVYAGNRIDEPDRAEPRFPTANVEAVRRTIRRILDEKGPALVVGAAASGADLIVLSEATRAAIPSHIVLPLEVTDFYRTSVSDQSEGWAELFDYEIDRCEELTVSDLSKFDDWYLRGNGLILEEAVNLADRNEEIVALVVQSDRDESSATADCHRKADRQGWLVIVVDPSDPSSE